MYDLQQENITTRQNITLLQYTISNQQRMAGISKLVAHDKRLPCGNLWQAYNNVPTAIANNLDVYSINGRVLSLQTSSRIYLYLYYTLLNN